MPATRQIAALGGVLLSLTSCAATTVCGVARIDTANLKSGAGRPVAQSVSKGFGAWCWFADPRAVELAGRTYVGWLDEHGNVLVATYDAAGLNRRTVIVRRSLG